MELRSLKSVGFSHFSARSDGKIISHRRRVHGGNVTFDPNYATTVTLRAPNNSTGSPFVRICNDEGRRVVRSAAFLIATAYINNPENLTGVDFLDGDRFNLSPDNLKWVERTEKVTEGYRFTSLQGCRGEVLHRASPDHVDVLLVSERALLGMNKVIITCTVASVLERYVKHPYHPEIQDIGCWGIGPFPTSRGGGKMHHLYQRWMGMLIRCGKNQGYENVKISEEMLVYQEYCRIVTRLMKETNIESLDGFELDKDYKGHNRKLYSRETVVLAPKRINRFLKVGMSRHDLPPGICYSPARNEIKSSLNIPSKPWFAATDSIEETKKNINTILNFYITHKKEKANGLLLTWQKENPSVNLDNSIISTLSNFDIHFCDVTLPELGWGVIVDNDVYRLDEVSMARSMDALRAKGYFDLGRKKKLYTPN